jgi:hypothetical protein
VTQAAREPELLIVAPIMVSSGVRYFPGTPSQAVYYEPLP